MISFILILIGSNLFSLTILHFDWLYSFWLSSLHFDWLYCHFELYYILTGFIPFGSIIFHFYYIRSLCQGDLYHVTQFYLTYDRVIWQSTDSSFLMRRAARQPAILKPTPVEGDDDDGLEHFTGFRRFSVGWYASYNKSRKQYRWRINN